MSEWKEVRIGDIANLYQGLAINKKTNYLIVEKSKLPLLRIKDLQKNTQKIFINDVDAPKNCIANIDDLIFTRTGIVGLVFMGKVGIVHNNCFRIVPKITDIYLPFYYHYFNRESMREYLTNISAGSVQPDMNHSIFKTVKVPKPSLPEQKAIAEVLSSLDDKIDLLHRQNKTLEQMAETLFRQWFVEEAKEDWEQVTLYDSIELIGGGTPKTSVKEYWNGRIKWLSGGDISLNHKSIIISSEKKITEEGLNNSSAKLLPKFSTVISARGTVGKYCILSEAMAFSQSNYGIIPKYHKCYFFTYLLINHSVEGLQAAAYGSVFDTITTNTFKGYNLKLPEPTIIKKFEEKVLDYFLKIFNNKNQIRTIEKIRDTLLPKLMRGEVRIRT